MLLAFLEISSFYGNLLTTFNKHPESCMHYNFPRAYFQNVPERINVVLRSLERFVEVVSTNAAKIFGLYPKKGVIAPGSDADIVILDPDKKHSLNAADLHMGTDLSVYEGMEVIGWPMMTILRGKVIAENDKFTGTAGEGKFVKGKLNETVMATV